MNNTYQLVCGLEVHAELKTLSKMFCGCTNEPFSAPKPNIYTCPVCLGMPGGSPVANIKAIEWTIKVGLALNCKINLFSKFDRKHYFYPDLPKGYQISQQDIPFCHDGYIDTSQGRVRINRIHLEEDTAKLLHTKVDGDKISLVDFNRSGVPLLEIVTEPDIHSAIQAKECGKKLRQVLRYLDVADCDMQEGGMRLEANVSLQRTEATKLPDYKVELKNINSFKFMEQAINYEIDRHSKLLDSGQTPPQETRGWSVEKSATFLQRSKEEAEDYRYFPDPDLPPVRFTQEKIDEIKSAVPELSNEKVIRWEKEFNIEPRHGELLTDERQTAEWYETLFIEAKENNHKPNDLAKAVINKKFFFTVGDDAAVLVTRWSKMGQTAPVDHDKLSAVIREIISENPDAVTKYRAGETKVLGFFIGQTARKLGEKIDANQLKIALEQALS